MTIIIPKKLKKYDKSLNEFFMFLINLVPPQRGQGLPVNSKYGHLVSTGEIFSSIPNTTGNNKINIDIYNSTILHIL